MNMNEPIFNGLTGSIYNKTNIDFAVLVSFPKKTY